MINGLLERALERKNLSNEEWKTLYHYAINYEIDSEDGGCDEDGYIDKGIVFCHNNKTYILWITIDSTCGERIYDYCRCYQVKKRVVKFEKWCGVNE